MKIIKIIIWKKLVIPQKNLEINEQNKGSILISLYEYANTTIQSVFFNNRMKNFNHLILYSISLYIFELMIKQINLVLYNIKYVFKYYYDDKKRAIIKRPSVSEIKDLLLNINSIIEKPNITNKAFQDFIINLSKYIANLNLNKNQTKPIVSQYLELYRGNNKVNRAEIKKSLQFGNIYNDFSPLQIKDSNYMINEIMNLLNECKNNLFKYYLVQDFDDNHLVGHFVFKQIHTVLKKHRTVLHAGNGIVHIRRSLNRRQQAESHRHHRKSLNQKMRVMHLNLI